jgi:hypothetical protein
LTATEFRNAPTGADTLNLVYGNANANAQTAELVNVIARASGWIDNQCNQPLVAAQHTQILSSYVPPATNLLSLHPDIGPLNQLVSLKVGTEASDLSLVDISGAWIERGQFQVPVYWQGNVVVQPTYVSGWGNTTLTGSTTAGATSLPVADVTGFSPSLGAFAIGSQLTIYDADKTETVTLTGVSGSNVTCSATVNAHTAGACVSMLPGDIKQVAIMVTNAFLRGTPVGSGALVMATSAPTDLPLPGSFDPTVRSQLSLAASILSAYERVR